MKGRGNEEQLRRGRKESKVFIFSSFFFLEPVPRTIASVWQVLNKLLVKQNAEDFPGGLVVKNPPANAGDMGSILALGRFHVWWSN